MPQGYKNSPSTFQRATILMFDGLIGKRCLVYIDDILVYGDTIEEHDENPRMVKLRIMSYGLTENKSR